MANNGKMVKLKGISAWAKVQKPDPTYDEYSITLILDSKKEVEKAKEAGLKITKVDKEIAGLGEDVIGKPCVKARQKSKYDDETPRTPPACVDSKANKFGGLIGNGSKVVVAILAFPYNNKFGKGVSSILKGVQVLDLVEFKSEGLFSEEKGSFVAEEKEESKSAESGSDDFDW